MNIALVSPYDHSTPGGVRQHVVNLDEQLRALGHRTRILAPASNASGLAANVTCMTRSVQSINISGSVARISLSPAAVLRVHRALRRDRFDVIHLHEPLIPTVAMSALLTANAPLIGTIHGYRDGSPLYAIGRPVLARLMRRLSAKTAVSSDAVRWAEQYFRGPYEIISDGVNVARFAGDGGASVPSHPRVLFVGRLDERKGFEYLLEAFAQVQPRFPATELVVAGAYTEADRARYERTVRSRALRGVRFIGRVAEEELPGLYRSATVFCAPSTGFEALGIVLLEAMAAGASLVTTNIEGYRTVVRDGVEALVVPPRDGRALARALAALLGDGDLRRTLAEGARKRVTLYDWPILARRYVALYEAVRLDRAKRTTMAAS